MFSKFYLGTWYGTENSFRTDKFSWHQDVNPLNILVKSRGSGRYDCDFKLADLGLSHFEVHMSFLRDASTRDSFGTSAYGKFRHFRGYTLNLLIPL